jgi:hypothetical protein
VVTVTSTVPVPAGEVAVIVVVLSTTTSVAKTPPNFTEVTEMKEVPVMVTEVPPLAGPVAGLTSDTTGATTVYVNLSALDVGLVPYWVTTVTSTVPEPRNR